jgi:hypothetical protein
MAIRSAVDGLESYSTPGETYWTTVGNAVTMYTHMREVNRKRQ